MPFKSGIEATREIVKRDGKAVIVMCSALGQESLVMEAIEAGASDFIVKPFSAEDVLAVVKKVLGDGVARPARPVATRSRRDTSGCSSSEASEHLDALGRDLVRLERAAPGAERRRSSTRSSATPTR